jgi:hypothetical protein
MSFSENPNNHSTNYIKSSIGSKTVIPLPEGPMYDEKGKPKDKQYPALDGKQSMLHSLSVLHYNDFLKQGPKYDAESYVNTSSRYYTGDNANGYKNPTGSQIVSAFDEKQVEHAMQYKWGDFLFVDHYGKVPNNHLITLRRFPQPSNDNLLNNLENPNRDVSRLLTYIDGEDNTFESTFSFSTGLNWKEFKSEIQTMEKSKTGWGGLNFLGYADTSGGFAKEGLQGKAATAHDPYTEHQNNYVWGPIDVVDSIMTRDKGIKFEQDLTIKFRYAVRSYDGISTKAAFLDIIGNMMNMVSNKAPFWGGAVRFTGGGGHSGPLGDSKALKNGDIDGFLSSFIGDIGKKLEGAFEGGLLKGIKTIAGNVGSKMLGGSLDKLGRPEMFSLHSLLTANPTGEWHLTVGNPFNPAMMLGNLIMEDASWGMEGPFTADDVPSYVLLEIKLKHAMPRDKYGIQRMFNFGGSRFYGSNTDFDNKSYYRNKDMQGGGGKLTPPAKIAGDAAKASTGGATTAYISSKYQSAAAATASA